MKLIHIADVHLLMAPEKGTSLEHVREKELWETFGGIIDVCNREQADLLLIAGDLFHRAPRQKDLKEVNYLFSKLKGTRVVLIAGNHDYIGTSSYYRNFPWNAGVHFLEDEALTHVTFPDLRTTVYGFSYHTRDIREARYDDVMPAGDGISILLAHGGDAKDVPINYRKLGANGFDYVAMGHIHKPEIMADYRMAYAGSPEPLDKNETGAHGYMQVVISGDAEGKQTTQITFVPFAKRRYIDLPIAVSGQDTQGSLADRICAEIEKQGTGNLYRVFLTGKRAADLHINTADLQSWYYITEVQDATLPEYDFDLLSKQNADNLIGMYIEKLRGQTERADGEAGSEGIASAEEREVMEKALYYGLEALLSK